MSRPLQFSSGEYYHIYNRGTDKRVVFQDNSDYQRFIALLYLTNSTKKLHISQLLKVKRRSVQGEALNKINALDLMDTETGKRLVAIGAYCLMPNHFHLLIKEVRKDGISEFMQKLTTAYTMYFNKRNARTGSLFENVFKAKHAHSDEYLKYLISYIHLNPIKLIDPNWKKSGIANKTEAKKFLSSFIYSSYLDYLGKKRALIKILKREEFPEYFKDIINFEETIEDWLAFSDIEDEPRRSFEQS